MSSQTNKKSKGNSAKGQKIMKPDINNPDENPLLKVENKADFNISTGNLLETPTALIYNDFDIFDLKKEKDHFDIDKLNDNSTIIIILRYYEYICTARFTFKFIMPILQSGLILKDVFEMIKHCLKTRLLISAPSFDTIFEMELDYKGLIKYK